MTVVKVKGVGAPAVAVVGAGWPTGPCGFGGVVVVNVVGVAVVAVVATKGVKIDLYLKLCQRLQASDSWLYIHRASRWSALDRIHSYDFDHRLARITVDRVRENKTLRNKDLRIRRCYCLCTGDISYGEPDKELRCDHGRCLQTRLR
jgi:hypothetical protein